MIANPTNATKPGGLLCRRPLEGVKPDPVAAATPATPLHWPGKQPAPTSGRPLQHCRAMFDARNSPALRPRRMEGRPLEGVKPPAISPAP